VLKLARLAAALALTGLAAGLPACSNPAATNASVPASSGGPGGPFTLVDQDGKPTTQAVLNGKWSVVFFGYTFCPDVCPTTLTTLGQTMTLLGPQAKDVQVVFVTVDPARDTPAALKTYLSSRVFPKNIIGLTGTPAQIAEIAKGYKVFYQKQGTGPGYSMDHSTALYVMGPDGQFRTVIADDLTPQQDAQQLTDAMRGT
jgi:protein SCO1/2